MRVKRPQTERNCLPRCPNDAWFMLIAASRTISLAARLKPSVSWRRSALSLHDFFDMHGHRAHSPALSQPHYADPDVPHNDTVFK